MNQPPDRFDAADGNRPTHVRHWVVLATVLMSILLYLDRFCISFAERLIKEDLDLSNEQISWILSAFFWSYALGQVPAGWLSDRFGSRLMLSIYVLLWSVFTALTGLASGFLMLFMLRLGFGLGQAGAFPTAGGVLSKWTPIATRGTASGLVASGGRVGGAIAPVVTALLIVMFVPVTAPSKLASGDLFNAARFSHLLHNPPPKTAAIAEQALSRFSSQAASHVAVLAESHRPDEPSPLSAADGQLLADALNQLLADRTFYEADRFAALDLPREATRLAKQDPQALKSEEVERLNRLLLETAFPTEIKKVYVAGWRPVLLVYGLVGIVVAGLIWVVFRNRPQEHPACNAAEIELITHGQPPASTRRLSGIPWKSLVSSQSLWLSSISQVGTNIGWVFLVTWLPRYLEEVHRVPVETRGVMASIPLVVGWVGMLLGGRLTDRMVHRFGLRWGRALPMGLTRFLGMGAFLFCLLPVAKWFGPDWAPWVLTAAFGMVAFATDLGVAAVWAFCQDVGGRHVGSVLGWGNMWGNLGAAVSPLLLNWMIGKDGSWDGAFIVCAVSFLISGLAALGVDATRPIVPEESEATHSVDGEHA
jgi:nitrate/nitrite transporter NarK